MNKRKLLVVAGPSGVGKSTLVSMLGNRYPEFQQTVSATTRAPRTGEIEGVSYYFLSPEEFQGRVSRNEFLEHATVYGKHSYGTLAEPTFEMMSRGVIPVLAIDVQGHELVRNHPASKNLARSIFINLPQTELEARLRGREGGMAEDDVQRRLAEATRERARMSEFDRIIVNDRPLQVVFEEFKDTIQELLLT